MSQDPNNNGGNAPQSPAPLPPLAPYANTAEQLADQSRPDYKTSEAVQQRVDARIRLTLDRQQRAGIDTVSTWTPESGLRTEPKMQTYNAQEVGPSGYDWSGPLSVVEPWDSEEEMRQFVNDPRNQTDPKFAAVVKVRTARWMDGYRKVPVKKPGVNAPTSQAIQPFRSARERQLAFGDKRYDLDAAYRDEVGARAAITPDFLP